MTFEEAHNIVGSKNKEVYSQDFRDIFEVLCPSSDFEHAHDSDVRHTMNLADTPDIAAKLASLARHWKKLQDESKFAVNWSVMDSFKNRFLYDPTFTEEQAVKILNVLFECCQKEDYSTFQASDISQGMTEGVLNLLIYRPHDPEAATNLLSLSSRYLHGKIPSGRNEVEMAEAIILLSRYAVNHGLTQEATQRFDQIFLPLLLSKDPSLHEIWDLPSNLQWSPVSQNFTAAEFCIHRFSERPSPVFIRELMQIRELLPWDVYRNETYAADQIQSLEPRLSPLADAIRERTYGIRDIIEDLLVFHSNNSKQGQPRNPHEAVAILRKIRLRMGHLVTDEQFYTDILKPDILDAARTYESTKGLGQGYADVKFFLSKHGYGIYSPFSFDHGLLPSTSYKPLNVAMEKIGPLDKYYENQTQNHRRFNYKEYFNVEWHRRMGSPIKSSCLHPLPNEYDSVDKKYFSIEGGNLLNLLRSSVEALRQVFVSDVSLSPDKELIDALWYVRIVMQRKMKNIPEGCIETNDEFLELTHQFLLLTGARPSHTEHKIT